MLAAKPKPKTDREMPDAAKLEFYRLIGEGYRAMRDGRTSTIEEVRDKLKSRRKDRG